MTFVLKQSGYMSYLILQLLHVSKRDRIGIRFDPILFYVLTMPAP